MWSLDVFQLQMHFYSKEKVNLILVICVKSFEAVIVKITCFIHNAFCIIDLLPVNNFHYWIEKIHFTVSTKRFKYFWIKTEMLLTDECYIVYYLLTVNMILTRAQAYA